MFFGKSRIRSNFGENKIKKDNDDLTMRKILEEEDEDDFVESANLNKKYNSVKFKLHEFAQQPIIFENSEMYLDPLIQSQLNNQISNNMCISKAYMITVDNNNFNPKNRARQIAFTLQEHALNTVDSIFTQLARNIIIDSLERLGSKYYSNIPARGHNNIFDDVIYNTLRNMSYTLDENKSRFSFLIESNIYSLLAGLFTNREVNARFTTKQIDDDTAMDEFKDYIFMVSGSVSEALYCFITNIISNCIYETVYQYHPNILKIVSKALLLGNEYRETSQGVCESRSIIARKLIEEITPIVYSYSPAIFEYALQIIERLASTGCYVLYDMIEEDNDKMIKNK